LVDCFDKCPNLEGNLKLDELLDGIWNMNEVYCENGDVFTFERLTVGEYIIQHVKEEKDMSYKSMLLDMLKFKYVSDSIVIKFIEKIVNPEVRTGEEQILYVNKINEIISTDGFELAISKRVSGELFYKIYKKHTRKGIMKNLIFAPLGSKPDIVIDDAIDNDLRLIGDFDNCLMYDFESDDNGLTWNKLVKWWGNKTRSENVQKDLYKRLISSLDSKPEKIFFQHYYMIFKDKEKYPALIPQVFLHYDPYAKNWRGNSVIYTHQRMDFLMLLPNGVRIVFEIDGKQHYSNGDTSSPCLYAEMVSDTRKLQLQGYEVYRFGGYEFVDINSAKQMIREFFEKLFKKYIIF
jgi:hypothetical protein